MRAIALILLGLSVTVNADARWRQCFYDLDNRVTWLEKDVENLEQRVIELEEGGWVSKQFYLVDRNNWPIGPIVGSVYAPLSVWIENLGALVLFTRQGPHEHAGVIYYTETSCGGAPHVIYQNEMALDEYLIIDSSVWRFSHDFVEGALIRSQKRKGQCVDFPAKELPVIVGEHLGELPEIAPPYRIAYQ